MAAIKQRADAQKQKEKKEKIILAVLVVVLIVVGAIMLPGMLKSGGTSAPVATGTNGTTTTSSAADTSSSAGTASSGGAPTSGSGGAVTFSSLPGYQPADGQLSQFGLFATKDPFGNTPGSETNSTGTNTTGTGTKPSSTTMSTSTSPYVAAVISVDGTSQVVPLGASFPSSSPTFTLQSISAGSVKIGVAGGSFSGGQSVLTLRKGRLVVLENTADGTRYALKLISVLKAGETTTVTTATETTATGTTATETTATETTTTTGT